MSYIQAIKAEHKARKLRKQGKEAKVVAAEITRIVRMPVYDSGYHLGTTMEGSVLQNLTFGYYSSVNAEFKKEPLEVRQHMACTPKDDATTADWVERARWWRDLLRRSLEPPQSAFAFGAILRWYRHCINCRNQGFTSRYPEHDEGMYRRCTPKFTKQEWEKILRDVGENPSDNVIAPMPGPVQQKSFKIHPTFAEVLRNAKEAVS